jgi:hypothetical protein
MFYDNNSIRSMPGGILQLVAVGSQDQYITGAPEMSYFKAVYKRHTNFSMESVKQTFLTKPTLDSSTSTVVCKIGRVADLLGEVYLSFKLPDIYSSDKYRFKWIKHVAQYMVYSYAVRIDTQLIDQGYGEWIDIWNELTLPPGKKVAYDRMTGNVQSMFSPISNKPKAIIENNRIRYTYYPDSTAAPFTPSIKGRRIILPLPFWFTRNPALALPLVALQYQTIEVVLELRSVEDLYQLYDERNDTYVSPSRYRELYADNVAIGKFLNPAGTASNVIDIDAYLECNYIFLDENERRVFATSSMDYLIERVYRNETGGITRQSLIDMYVSNPIKEFVWITRRSDINRTNEWSNLTATIPDNSEFPILKTAKVIWNGLDRIDEKPFEYFNMIQPYQHHSNGPRQGIYCYSFAIYPEKWQPSGSFNASTINRIQMYVTLDDTTSMEYTVTIYSIYYNVFRVMGGSGAMAFAN